MERIGERITCMYVRWCTLAVFGHYLCNYSLYEFVNYTLVQHVDGRLSALAIYRRSLFGDRRLYLREIKTSTSVFGDGRMSTQANPAYTSRCGVANWNIHRASRAGRFVRFWASVGAKFTNISDSLPWTPMNRRAKPPLALSSAEKSVTIHTQNTKKTQ